MSGPSAGSVTVASVNSSQSGLPPSLSLEATGTGLALAIANGIISAATSSGLWLGSASTPGYTGFTSQNQQLYVAGLIQDLSNALATVLAPYLT